MPNWSYNYLTIHAKGNTLKKIKKEIITIKRENNRNIHLIDFQKIIPMPQELQATSYPNSIVSPAKYAKAKKENKYPMPITYRMQQDFIRDYGYDNWYEWCINTWGTKWSPSVGYVKGNLIYFKTAWTIPYPVIKKLSEIYPNIKFTVKFYGEDYFGSEVGEITYLNGETEEQEYLEEEKEIMEFIFELDPSLKEEYKLINGEYIHIDEIPNSVNYILNEES